VECIDDDLEDLELQYEGEEEEDEDGFSFTEDEPDEEDFEADDDEEGDYTFVDDRMTRTSRTSLRPRFGTTAPCTWVPVPECGGMFCVDAGTTAKSCSSAPTAAPR
jgi:hypothetical protein